MLKILEVMVSDGGGAEDCNVIAIFVGVVVKLLMITVVELLRKRCGWNGICFDDGV